MQACCALAKACSILPGAASDNLVTEDWLVML